MLKKLAKLYERVWYCWFGTHNTLGFTSYRLPGGVMRVVRCEACRHLEDVLYLPDNSDKTLAISVEATPGFTCELPQSVKSMLEK